MKYSPITFASMNLAGEPFIRFIPLTIKGSENVVDVSVDEISAVKYGKSKTTVFMKNSPNIEIEESRDEILKIIEDSKKG